MDGVLCDFDRAVHDRYAELYPGEPNIPMERDVFTLLNTMGQDLEKRLQSV